MSYTVIARRWRPKTLDEVVGQRHVTQTLRNALASGRIAQAFVFAGPRGVGKTTTARILARMLNCDRGPTPDPCGVCDACLEIAEGRDMDVLEIDAATHTQVDNIRDVIISGLAMLPVRDRFKVFIIDEVHQLSSHSFNALLKSVEEPPPHVTFIMATTAPDKIPDTIVSRSQVFEFKTIASRAIADQLRRIADTDGIQVSDEALALIARAAEGSMRDAETAFDQVIAFAGQQISPEDVASVLGLVGRDLLFDVMTAVADENGPAAFELAGRAVEAGYDLRLLCRELSRLTRDVMVLAIDPSRFDDADVAPEPDRGRLRELVDRFSREDLLRAFDLLTRAETDIRAAAEPRYHLEMALLRWIHVRKLTPLSDLIERLEGGGSTTPPGGARQQAGGRPTRPPATGSSAPASGLPTASAAVVRPTTANAARPATTAVPDDSAISPAGDLKAGLLAEIRRTRAVFHGTVVAQARAIVVRDDCVAFSFSQAHGLLAEQVGQARSWLEPLCEKVAGRKMTIVVELVDGTPERSRSQRPGHPRPSARDARAEALASPVVQALLEIFPSEVKDVTELKGS
ncbi:MAG: DNA polymerase III subunit gamma/tau [Acidobacteriota bacterium]